MQTRARLNRLMRLIPRKYFRVYYIGHWVGWCLAILLPFLVIWGAVSWNDSAAALARAEFAAEWGEAKTVPITDRQPVIGTVYQDLVREVFVTTADGRKVSVIMKYTTANRDTTQVWHNAKTGETYIVGDYLASIAAPAPNTGAIAVGIGVLAVIGVIGAWVLAGMAGSQLNCQIDSFRESRKNPGNGSALAG